MSEQNRYLKLAWTELKHSRELVDKAMGYLDQAMKLGGAVPYNGKGEVTDVETAEDIPLEEMSRPQLLHRAGALGYTEQELRGKHLGSLKELILAKESLPAAPAKPVLKASKPATLNAPTTVKKILKLRKS